MRQSEHTPEDRVAKSVESLRETLRNAPETASEQARKHVEQLIDVGETIVRLQQRPRPEVPPGPLSVSAARIARTLVLMAVVAVATVVLHLVWNVFFG
jgi:hypothetical protein